MAAALFHAVALPEGVMPEEGAPTPPVGGGLLAEDERGRLYVMGADGLLRITDSRAAVAAARCVVARAACACVARRTYACAR